MFGVGFFRPGCHFGLENLEFADSAAVETWARQAAEFACRDIEPTAVLRRIAELQPANIGAGLIGLEGFVECPLGVGVQIVYHQGDDLAVGVPDVEQVTHFQGPIYENRSECPAACGGGE